jgi:hypothetical protein
VSRNGAAPERTLTARSQSAHAGAAGRWVRIERVSP